MIVVKIIAKNRAYYVGPFPSEGDADAWVREFYTLRDELARDAGEEVVLCE